ncbi:MAG: tetratricopeptide repeat protein, partial [Deltaproteobacteria bacterium]
MLAAALGANSHDDQALLLVESALTHRPKYAEAFASRASFKLRRKDFAGALEDVEKSLSIKPHLAQLWGIVGSLRYQFNNLHGAIDALEKVLELEPDNVSHIVNLGEFKRQAGLIDAAII